MLQNMLVQQQEIQSAVETLVQMASDEISPFLNNQGKTSLNEVLTRLKFAATSLKNEVNAKYVNILSYQCFLLLPGFLSNNHSAPKYQFP